MVIGFVHNFKYLLSNFKLYVPLEKADKIITEKQLFRDNFPDVYIIDNCEIK